MKRNVLEKETEWMEANETEMEVDMTAYEEDTVKQPRKGNRTKKKRRYAYVGTTGGKIINAILAILFATLLPVSCIGAVMLFEEGIYSKEMRHYYEECVEDNGLVAEIGDYYDLTHQKEKLTDYEKQKVNEYKQKFNPMETNLRYWIIDEDGEFLFGSEDELFLECMNDINEGFPAYTFTLMDKSYFYDDKAIITVYVLNPELTGISGDSYAIADRQVEMLYQLADVCIAGIILSAIGLIVFFALAVYGAGRKKDYEEIVLSGINGIPLDVLTVLAIAMGLFFILVCSYVFNTFNFSISSDIYDVACGLFLICSLGSMCFVYLLSFIARCKKGNPFKDMLCLRAIKWIFSEIKDFLSHISKTWIAVAVEVVIFLFLCVVMPISYSGRAFFIWLLFVAASFFAMKHILDLIKMEEQIQHMVEGDLENNRVEGSMLPWMRNLSEQLVHVGEGMRAAVENEMKSEHLKTELITNVSHDIKTPITSIINYVNLLQKGTETEEQYQEYLEVLDRQSHKLKKLTEDLVQFSKANTGNMEVHMETLHLQVLLDQVCGEYAEKFEEKGLVIVTRGLEEEMLIEADGRLVWRIFDNLFGNLYKYAMPGTRVYVDGKETEWYVELVIKNISKEPLNITGEELKDRFVRGDSSRNTEGSGLGLSIAESFVKMMGGQFDVVVDGDLFKVVVTLKKQGMITN